MGKDINNINKLKTGVPIPAQLILFWVNLITYTTIAHMFFQIHSLTPLKLKCLLCNTHFSEMHEYLCAYFMLGYIFIKASSDE